MTADGTTSGNAGRILSIATIVSGGWSIALLFLGPALGFELDVPADVEVVDHVVPGAVVVTCGVVAFALFRRGRAAESLSYVLAVGFTFLAGVWMTATHVPLLLTASRGLVRWGTALWHSIPGFAVLALAVALYAVASSRRPAPGAEDVSDPPGQHGSVA